MRASKIRKALSFDDVSIVPDYSEVLPSQTEVGTRLTRKLRLKIPLMSAAMDTVTEARLAIAMARLGGLGVIHKNMPPAEQARQVAMVKRAQSGMIVQPLTVRSVDSLRDAKTLMEQHGVSGLPVCDGDELVGILTARDIRFETDLDRRVAAIMTPRDKLVTAPEGTSQDEARQLLHERRIEKLLIVDATGGLVGLITVKDLQRDERFPQAALDNQSRLLVAAAIGTGQESLARAAELVRAEVDVLVIDTAHGHSRGVIDMICSVKNAHPNIELIAGNIATAEAAKALIAAGADAIKVGMGPGSICTTRIVAGIGVPQLTAIMDCVEAAEKFNVPVIADGGIRYSGDVAKAIAAGADVVMIGSLFAGTDEAPGEVVTQKGRPWKLYRGMGSLGAMRDGSKDRYGQAGVEYRKLVPEGIEGLVAYSGSLAANVEQLVGGLRAAMGYTGCRSILEFQDGTEFVEVTSAGLTESHPHNVDFMAEAPNYRR